MGEEKRTRRGFLSLFIAGLAGIAAMARPAESQTPPRTVNNHLIPSRDNQYNLGSRNRRWRSISAGPESVQVWNQPSDSQPSIKLTTEQLTDPNGNTATVGSIQMGDGNQLKVSISGGAAGDFEEEVVIKSLLPDKGTGLNIVASGNPSDATSLRLAPRGNFEESFSFFIGPGDVHPTILHDASSLRPIRIGWFDGSGWKPFIIFKHLNDGTTLMDIQSDTSGKENLTLGESANDEAFINQSYDPSADGSPRNFWLGGWFNQNTGEFTPGFRLMPPQSVAGQYTVAHLGHRQSFQYDEWLTLFARHENSGVEFGIDQLWNSSITGSTRGIFYLGGWFDAHTGNFKPGIILTHDGESSTSISTENLTIVAQSDKIQIQNPSIESSSGGPAGYLKVKIGSDIRLIPLYAPT
ncbi:MAG: hypothetical protein QXU87_10765 [Candidatus Caldarchaeum sp.]